MEPEREEVCANPGSGQRRGARVRITQGNSRYRGRRKIMDVHEMAAQARDAMTVKRAYGEPYGKDGLTIISAAKVSGGGGAGGGEGGQSSGAATE